MAAMVSEKMTRIFGYLLKSDGVCPPVYQSGHRACSFPQLYLVYKFRIFKKRHEELTLFKRYYGNEEEYPHYANYDAIEVSKVSDIP